MTRADMLKMKHKFDSVKEQVKDQATADATLYVHTLTFKALIEAFDFTIEDFNKLMDKENEISAKLLDETNDYTFNTIRNELAEMGIGIETK